ncbi:MAG TPA: alpha/beta hydrolase [Halieaceae bacterium]|jgi:acetyl esterase/lipase|uniref:alpha/beta hydrolase fold domain-containing protein n=1 Tax=Haliea TaxID=475794 RepID=UPI000C4EB4E4|nr:alpha/beta hydrolase fold domain-containing protein [Haliea sp.]HAN69724.1 alpha/beta hydrolase [Halieaceae bacterium]MAD65827.1 alpha/beta hydrolase [Haliea sp.]MAY91315.1 alpha/beta hydrolase [Haliea sp.]MBK40804.1 alpha/beta hydrolase [Haliea sp.]MBP69200.1 alpha/beta hydrolase [Haliea sp.]|tara:strand:+ start:5749 stop:6735 length:987 start_codon:yes stop_codon:yes gene_type:complete
MAYRIDDSGTAWLGDHPVPVPTSISDEARAYLAGNPWGDAPMPDEPVPMWTFREPMAVAFEALNQQAQSLYPVDIEEIQLGGVRCHLIRPLDIPAEREGRVLINLHGGGFVVGSGALVEAIPIAHLARVPVIAVDYRLAPEHAYPAAVDDVVAVYREVLAHHPADKVGIFGSSAGGILTGQAVVRLEKEGLPLPACAGVFSAAGNLYDFGDTRSIFTLSGFYGAHSFPLDHELSEVHNYLGGADPMDPLVSPDRADLSRFPPTLLVSGTRDALLSSTTMFHRALLRAGRPAELVVFDALPHSHWYALHLPETREALDIMVRFFNSKLA